MKHEVRIWQHKKNKKKLRATPWWEIPESILDDEFKELMKGRKIKFGVLIQVGWLLENEHGVWLGVGPAAAKEFNDLGEWKKK
jgi:hypothetical protein